MEIKYEIAEEKIKNFTESAKNRLQEQSKKYTLEIINESEKVERLIRENGASTEITDSIIFQAIRRSRTGKKVSAFFIILRIIAELFLYLSGLMFMPEMFVKNNTFNVWYFTAFAVVTLIALIATIVTYFIGGE